MCACEFGYNRYYVDYYVSVDSFKTLMQYREDNPPIGNLFKHFMYGLSGKTPPKRSDGNKENDISELAEVANVKKMDKDEFNKLKEQFYADDDF